MSGYVDAYLHIISQGGHLITRLALFANVVIHEFKTRGEDVPYANAVLDSVASFTLATG